MIASAGVLLALAAQPQIIHQRFADFVTGRFTDAGAGVYVSARGRIQTIPRWDLNGDGFFDLVFANSHPHAEKLDAMIYWGNGDNFDVSRSTPLVTNGAQRTIVADLNGDGRPDLILPNYHNGTHDRVDSYVYLHDGKTPHAISRRIGLPTQAAQHAAVADFNRDGYLDIVFAFSGGFWEYRADPWSPYESPSRIYWGGKDGYTPEKFTDVPTLGASAAAAADINGDGWPDLILAAKESKVSHDVESHLYWGGPGGFSAARRVALATRGANMVAIADVDRDGKPDVIFANGVGPSSYVYLNDGVAFSNRIDLETNHARDVTVSDLNGDGWPDIVFANYADSGNPLAYSFVYWGSSKGFSSDRRLKLETVGATGVAAGDLNHDGLLDIVVSCFRDFTSHDVPSYVYWNSPKGFDGFRRTSLYTHGAAGAAIADLNGDGHADLVLNSTTNAYRGGFQPVFVYWGDAKGGYSTARRLSLPAIDAYESAAADLNDDGYADLLIVNSGEDRRSNQESTIFWGGRDGFSVDRATGLSGNKSLGAGIADLDRDGFLDVVLVNSASLSEGDSGSFIYWGARPGYSPLRRTDVPADGATSVSIGDLNGDGRLDLVFSNDRTERGVAIYWGDGSRNYSPMRRTFVPDSAGTGTVELADLNKDGSLDLIAGRGGQLHTPGGASFIYWGNARGEFTTAARLAIPTEGALGITVADVNSDGWLDLVFPNYGTGTSRSGMSRVFWGGPKGYSEERLLLLPSDGGTGAWAADFNRDTFMDLLLLNHRREGDPSRVGVFNEHRTGSFLYWGGPKGLRSENKLEIPGEGVHNGRNLDVGNILDRRNEYEYTSAPLEVSGSQAVLAWDAETPGQSSLAVEVRTAGSQELLAKASWQNPGGVLKLSGRWLQYRVFLRSNDGVNFPVLKRVEIKVQP